MPGRVRRSAETIFWLGTKELRSFLHDTVLIVLVVYAFSFAVFSQARSNSQELSKASIAVADEDNSPLSRRIMHAFLPPLFLPPQPIAVADIVPAMNTGRYTFVVDVPTHFERDVLAAIIHQLEAILCRDGSFSRDGCAGVRIRCHLGSDMRMARCGGVRGWWRWVTAGHAAPPFS